jgi:penicillin-binding protein 1A
VEQRLSWFVRAAVVVIAGSLFVTAAVVGMAPQLWRIANATSGAPVELPSFVGLAGRSLVFDVADRQIGAYAVENIQPLAFEDVPEHVYRAILAVEDAGFFEHKGVNVRALVRATLSNFQSDGGRQGASTITQQVVKNEYLAGLPRDGRYKILQMRYAVMLERIAPKERILERYLNTVFFGNNAYGLKAAAEVYFGKRVADLTLEEAGFLAGLIRAPSAYDPIRRPEQARLRFDQVLDRLVAVDLMDRVRADATAETFELPRSVTFIPEELVRRSYFTEMVRDQLLNKSDVLGATYAERYRALYRGGLRIHTTLDSEAQVAAELAVAGQLPANKTGVQAALVSVDTATGAVRAVVGGPGFTPRQSEINLALRRRQTGSAVKVFILTAALEAGVQPTDIIEGTLPCTLPNPGLPSEPFEIKQGVSNPLATLEEQTWLSINCAYARLSQIVGLHRLPPVVYKLASSPWLTPQSHVIQPYASFATGANELSPMDMAAGMQTIANSGIHHEPYLIERIEGPNGVIYEHEPSGAQVVSKAVADTQVAVMKGVMTRGTARRTQLAGGRVSAGKTGTQDDNTNAWFVGFTPQLTTAVWVGDPKGYTPMVNIPEFRAVGVPRVQGSTFPARIWKAYMDAAHRGWPSADWGSPPPPVRNQQRLYLPGLDCLAQVISGGLPASLVGPVVPTVVPTVPTSTVAPPTTASTSTTTTTTVPGAGPAPTPSPTPGTVAPAPSRRTVVREVDPGTTIPTSIIDPYHPVPGVDPAAYLVYECTRRLPSSLTFER